MLFTETELGSLISMSLTHQDPKLNVRQQPSFQRPAAAGTAKRPVFPDIVTHRVGDGVVVVWELKYVRLNWIQYNTDDLARCVRFLPLRVRADACVTQLCACPGFFVFL